MASSTTSNVYVHVIEDVINKVRDEFVNNGGPGDDVLSELQGIWELKMMQAGAILGPIDRSAMRKTAAGGPLLPNAVHDLNVAYDGTEEYETPTADLLFPPTPLQTPMMQTPLPGMTRTPLPGTDGSLLYDDSTGGTPITEFPPANSIGGVPEIKTVIGRPNTFMHPPSSLLNQRPPLDVNVAYVEGREEGERGASHHSSTQDFLMMSAGKRKRGEFPTHYHAGGYIPQQDGSGDAPLGAAVVRETVQHLYFPGGIKSSRIPQADGPIPDPYDDALSTPNIYNYQGVVNEDYNIVNTPAPEMLAATPAPVQNDTREDEDDDEPLNEDDDDDELDGVEQGEDLNTTHLVLAQFDKVTRAKSRWKCILKDGIMHINNKDILFNKATGEFDF